ncbi:hypothetical protein C8C83_4109 [Flavobacterium sp. 90]|nr:hypothetical protein C8C82_4442 [Flavobacterium sp. 81]TCK56097.1 hypothetical protein C8C83_4109 [Flavobacterium sp. 90]
MLTITVNDFTNVKFILQYLTRCTYKLFYIFSKLFKTEIKILDI